jgi:hypothetical protein
MERTTFKDLAVYYEYTPGQKGGFDQPEFAPQVDIVSLMFIEKAGLRHDLDPETESALLEKFGDRIEREILS